MFLNSIFLQLVNKATEVKLLWKYQKELEIKCIFFIIFRFVCYIKNGKYKKDPNTKAFNCLEFECKTHLNLGPAFNWHLNAGHLNTGQYSTIYVLDKPGIWIYIVTQLILGQSQPI